MKLKKTLVYEDYLCPSCGNKYPVLRSSGRRRDKKHLKNIYCPFCDMDVDHARIESYIGKHWYGRHRQVLTKK